MKRPWRLEYPNPSERPAEWAVKATYRTKIGARIGLSLAQSVHPDIPYHIRKNVHFEAKD